MPQAKARQRLHQKLGVLLAACLLLATSNLSLAQEGIKIVALGDSLTAGYQLAPGEGFPFVLERALKAKGYANVSIIDAGVSGDTTSGGLSRLDWALQPGTDAVILELGANDALRGIDPGIPRDNLDQMLKEIKKRGLSVLLAGMLAPPNMGGDYGKRFNAIYPDLAAKYGVNLYPFFLDGVAAQSGMTLDDGMHPSAKGVETMVARILPLVEKLIAEVKSKKSAEKGQ
jgi:acyl-CoA thioesterase-1